jgi:ATP-dependent RNA helicase DHX40
MIPGRVFPVHVNYCDVITEKDVQSSAYVHRSVEIAMDIHLDQPPGDILVFLTGQAEIDRACKALFERAETIDYRYDVQCKDINGLIVVPVYGSLPVGCTTGVADAVVV